MQRIQFKGNLDNVDGVRNKFKYNIRSHQGSNNETPSKINLVNADDAYFKF